MPDPLTDHLYAVDPGVHACGVALFVDRQLYACGLVPSSETLPHAPALWLVRPPVGHGRRAAPR